MSDLETVDLDGLGLQTKTIVLVDEEILDLVALIALELNHVAHALGLGFINDGAIAGYKQKISTCR